MSTIPEDEPITVAKLLWLVVRFDLVIVDVAQGAAIRSLHGHILIVVGNDETLMRDGQSKSSWGHLHLSDAWLLRKKLSRVSWS